MNRHQSEFSIRRMCQVLEVSASGFYAWRKRPPSQRVQANEALLTRIRLVYAQSRQTYGSPRIHAELRAQGVACGRHRVARLMRHHAVRPNHKRRYRRTTRVNPHLSVAANHLQQQFTAQRPNQVWLSDMTYVPTAEGWLYLAAILDLYSRRIVGWQASARLDTDLATQAWQMAIGRRCPPPGGLHHSDRGCQYASPLYQQGLTAQAWTASMSRTGNCYDNAPMESFFATLKTELVHRRTFRTRAEARAAIFDYIERFYNPHRRHSALGYRSPMDFETSFLPA
jgi:putative transposase